MRRTANAVMIGLFVALAATTGLSSQELTEICPGAEDGTGALWGSVTDEGMVLPGATVNASWTDDDEQRTSEVQVGLDGSYTMCYLPLATELTVQPMFATLAGEPVTLTLSEVFTQNDMTLSMSGGSASSDGDDRVWMCVNGGQSTLNIQNTRIIRCDAQWQPLERCPKAREFGQISAQPVGAGSGMMREMLEALVEKAEGLGANAIINVRDSRSSIQGQAVLIEVDPSTC